MKKKIIACTLAGTILVLAPMQAKALRCELWDALNSKETPLIVWDTPSFGALTITHLQQIIETVESGIQNETKKIKLEKWSKAGSDLSRTLDEISVPDVQDLEKGSQTVVDAFKGQTAGKIMPAGNVDFTKDDEVYKTVEAVAVVSNPIDSAERQSEIERKNAFIQQAVLDLNARILYYKSELEGLKQTDNMEQSISGSGDTIGSHDISMQLKDTNEKVQALQEKISAARLELMAIQNLKSAKPVQDKIDVKGDS